MLRALVLSDIHGEETTFRWMLEQVWKETGPIDAYLCLGDGVRDFERAERFIRERDEYAVMYAVKGNNDWCDVPPMRIIELGGVRIFMTHGHNQRVKSSLYYLQDAVRDAKCDVGLYGHTHSANIEMSTALLVNPGAVCSERCALLEIRDGKAHARLLNYGFR